MTVDQMLDALDKGGAPDMVFMSPTDAAELARDAARRLALDSGEAVPVRPVEYLCATPIVTVEDDEPVVCRCGTEVA